MHLKPGFMLPKSTRVEKTCRVQRFRGGVLVVEHQARSLDVPFGDLFATVDRWLVEPCDPEDDSGDEGAASGNGNVNGSGNSIGGSWVRVRVGKTVRFSSYTIFRGQVESQSTDGLREYHEQWAAFAREQAREAPERMRRREAPWMRQLTRESSHASSLAGSGVPGGGAGAASGAGGPAPGQLDHDRPHRVSTAGSEYLEGPTAAAVEEELRQAAREDSRGGSFDSERGLHAAVGDARMGARAGGGGPASQQGAGVSNQASVHNSVGQSRESSGPGLSRSVLPIPAWVILVVMALLCGFLAGYMVGRQGGGGDVTAAGGDGDLEARLLEKMRQEMRALVA